ncbi:MAG: helix-turn-helix domain-containing protein [Hyphomicrobiales bacterium]|nr:helix-turn-helix domain-containing protein [Hyphomicrobiales bacterium]
MRKSIHTSTYILFADLLVQSRKEARMTQQQLADRLGRPQSFVAKYEARERRLDVIELLEVTDALGVDPVEFVIELNEARRKDR